jgi:hypothetical protein
LSHAQSACAAFAGRERSLAVQEANAATRLDRRWVPLRDAVASPRGVERAQVLCSRDVDGSTPIDGEIITGVVAVALSALLALFALSVPRGVVVPAAAFVLFAVGCGLVTAGVP